MHHALRTMTPPDTLSGFPGFSDLPREHLTRLSRRVVRRKYTRGEFLWREGDMATALTLIHKGRVKITKHGPSDRDLLLEVAGPGMVIGEVAVYDGGRYPVSAISAGDVEVLQLPVQDALAVLGSGPDAVLSVVGSLARHARRLAQRAADLGEAGVERRLALAMCRLCSRGCDRAQPPPGGTVGIPVSLSRQDLADMVGTSVETAIRVVSRWARRGFVKTEREGFIVANCGALQKIVASSPRAGHRDRSNGGR